MNETTQKVNSFYYKFKNRNPSVIKDFIFDSPFVLSARSQGLHTFEISNVEQNLVNAGQQTDFFSFCVVWLGYSKNTTTKGN